MRSVGLTGSVAAGKSEVARAWREEGVPVVSADELAREVVEPGSPGLAEVVDAFGPDVLADDGTLDRDRLRSRVFDDPEARRRLEGILHPRIARRRGEWMREREAEGADLVAAEIPLLFEAGLEGDFDVVVVVDAPREERLRRVVEGRGVEPDEAERIMAAQMDPAAKRRRADRVIENRGSLEDLREEARRALTWIRREDPAGQEGRPRPEERDR